jgi:hypothetical protein
MRFLVAILTLAILSTQPLGEQQRKRPLVAGLLRADGVVLPYAVYDGIGWTTIHSDSLKAFVRSVRLWYATGDAGPQQLRVVDTIHYTGYDKYSDAWGHRTDYRGATAIGARLRSAVGVALSEPRRVIGFVPLEESSPVGKRLTAKVRADFDQSDAATTRRLLTANTLTASQRAQLPIRLTTLRQSIQPVGGRSVYVFAAERQYPGCEKGMTQGVALVEGDTVRLVGEEYDDRFHLADCEGIAGETLDLYGALELDGRVYLFGESLNRETDRASQRVLLLPARGDMAGPSPSVRPPVSEASRGIADSVYHCASDSFVNNPRPFRTADTLGWGARVARELPGYRLATEREIACYWDGERAFSGRDDRHAWWGSGRAWWLMPANFDGDRRPDVLALVVPVTDPRTLTLAAFHGTGKAYHVGPAERRALYDAGIPGVAKREVDPGGMSLKTDGIWDGPKLWAFVGGSWQVVHVSN